MAASDRAAPAKHTQATRLFGYDVFISFALGPPPRGSQSYASDLARRLREQDFAVFFSDDQAPPGLQLDTTLQSALMRSRALVVVANRGTLEDPRWIRTEVEEFRKRHPGRPIVPISVGGALQDAELSACVQPWLAHGDKIWIDESAESVATGIASDAVVERLATTPRFKNANARWRWTVRIAFALLAALALGLAMATLRVVDSNKRLQAALERSSLLRLGEGSLAMLSGNLAGTDERTLQQLVAAHRLLPESDADRWVLAGLNARESLQRLLPTDRSLQVPKGFGHHARVAISTDGRRFAVLGEQSLQVWSTQSAAPLSPAVPWGDDAAVVAGFSPDGQMLLTGHVSGALRRWNAVTGSAVGQPWRTGTDAVEAVAYSVDGRWVAAAVAGRIHYFDAASGRAGPTITGPALTVRPSVTRLLVDTERGHIVTGHLSGLLQLWEARTGAWTDLSEAGVEHGAPVNSLALSPDGSLVASGGEDGVVLVFGTKGLDAPVARMKDHRAGVTQVAFSPDGQRLMSASSDRTLRVWEAERWSGLDEPFEGHKDVVHAAAFSADGLRIVSVGADDTVRVWDGGAETPERQRSVLRSLVPSALSTDGQRAVTAAGDDGAALQWWDAATGAATGGPAAAHAGPVLALAFSADGTRAVSAGEDGSLRVWDARTGTPLGAAWRGHAGAVRCVAFSPDGQRVVSGGDDRNLRLWDAATGAADGAPLTGHAGAVRSAGFSPDGRWIVSGGTDDHVRLWDTKTRTGLPEPLPGPKGSVAHVAFSPDGSRIAAASVEAAAGASAEDGQGKATLRFWDAKTHTAVGGPWAGSETGALNFAFSPDSSRLVASGVEPGALAHPQDRGGQPTLRVWDARSGGFIGARRLQGIDRMFSPGFSPDGLRLTVGSLGQRLQRRPAPQAWPEDLCAKLTRNMSGLEWRDWVSPDIPYAVQCPGLPVAPDVAPAVKR